MVSDITEVVVSIKTLQVDLGPSSIPGPRAAEGWGK